jgi:radical SAM superfamily enzyme YgiQ (UPF0313 family)
MREANFVGIFVGIESPDTDTLVAMKKKQNTRRGLAESIHKIYANGMFVTAGFIVGFDSEKGSIADAMIELIEEAAIPVCMVGLLYALPNTQLTRRLEKEGRLHPAPDARWGVAGDQCTEGLNFDTLRPRAEILSDYKRILEKVYDPEAYAGRLVRLNSMLNSTGRRAQARTDESGRKFGTLERGQRIATNLPEPREIFWPAFKQCVSSNPKAAHWIGALTALYLHLGPFSRYVIGKVDQKIAGVTAETGPSRLEAAL